MMKQQLQDYFSKKYEEIRSHQYIITTQSNNPIHNDEEFNKITVGEKQSSMNGSITSSSNSLPSNK